MNFVKLRKKIVNTINAIDTEEQKLVEFISSLELPSNVEILDIGCGYGKKLRLMLSRGFNVVGIDVNAEIIRSNREAGMNCITLEEFNVTNEKYDVMLMLHVIEHFMPAELLKFMDSYLDRLKPGGHLIISTPLYTTSFYADFDHVKPYHPTGIKMVFGCESAQVQYYARNRIELVDIWFRRGFHVLDFSPGLYLRKYSQIPVVINLLSALLFRASFGLIGKTDGWMGLYKKI